MKKAEAYLRYKTKEELLAILKSSNKKKATTTKQYDDLRMLLDSMDQDALVRLLLQNINKDPDLKASIQRELSSRQKDIPNTKIILAQLREWSELLPRENKMKAKIRKLNQFLRFNPEIQFQFQKLFKDATNGVMQESELEYFTNKFSRLAPQIWDTGNVKYLVINPAVLFVFLFALLSLLGNPSSLGIASGGAVTLFFATALIRFLFFENIFAQSNAKDDMEILGDILKTQNEFVKSRQEADDNLLPEEANPVTMDAVFKRLMDTDDSETNLLETLGESAADIQGKIEAMLDQ